MSTAPTEGSRSQLTLRVSATLLRRVKAIAKRRGTSLNALLVCLLEACDREERELALKQAYEVLGKGDGADVAFAFAAQSEVARRG